jgi:hypothetical protein
MVIIVHDHVSIQIRSIPETGYPRRRREIMRLVTASRDCIPLETRVHSQSTERVHKCPGTRLPQEIFQNIDTQERRSSHVA